MSRQGQSAEPLAALGAAPLVPARPTLAQGLGAAVPTPARLTVDALGGSSGNETLNRLNSAVSELKALTVQPLLQRAMDALRAEQTKSACEWALKALEHDEESGFAWYVLAVALERAGDFANSLQAYEAALKLLPDHAEVANDLGRLAFRLGMIPQAEALFRHFMARRECLIQCVDRASMVAARLQLSGSFYML